MPLTSTVLLRDTMPLGSPFFTLTSIGSRFGCSHPIISYRQYNSLCIPIHMKILRTIQGVPSRCPSSTLNALLGFNDIESRIAQHKLNFINSFSCLNDISLLKRLSLPG